MGQVIELKKNMDNSIFYLKKATRLELPTALGSQLVHYITFKISCIKVPFFVRKVSLFITIIP